jgi:hypothetical protein
MAIGIDVDGYRGQLGAGEAPRPRAGSRRDRLPHPRRRALGPLGHGDRHRLRWLPRRVRRRPGPAPPGRRPTRTNSSSALAPYAAPPGARTWRTSCRHGPRGPAGDRRDRDAHPRRRRRHGRCDREAARDGPPGGQTCRRTPRAPGAEGRLGRCTRVASLAACLPAGLDGTAPSLLDAGADASAASTPDEASPRALNAL